MVQLAVFDKRQVSLLEFRALKYAYLTTEILKLGP
jgi:hypothetical protein